MAEGWWKAAVELVLKYHIILVVFQPRVPEVQDTALTGVDAVVDSFSTAPE